VIVGLLLLIAFMGSMFAALNVGIVGGTPATQTTAADVDIVNVIPGISGDNFLEHSEYLSVSALSILLQQGSILLERSPLLQ